MDFVKAAKSGKPFRRKGWNHYIYFSDSGGLTWRDGPSPYPDFRLEWLDAEDWEIDEPKATITYSQFWSIYRSVRSDSKLSSEYEVISELADRLGLKFS
jgi:hypothetical protein